MPPPHDESDAPHPLPYDLPAIFALRDAFAALDPAAPPRALVVREAAPSGRPTPQSAIRNPQSIGIFAGSFNPLTNAHAALAQAALETGGLDVLYLALSRRTVDKEGVDRPTMADRALVAGWWARRDPRRGVLLVNRGLYAEQAAAARAAFPAARDLRFVIGFDKARQIFDPRYYADRDAALGELFAAATLLVAPRAGAGPDALAALLDRPENRPFRPHVRALPFDPAYAADSATVVREAARAGRPYAGLVPPEVAAFIAEAHPYTVPRTPPDADVYTLREAAIAPLAADRDWAERHADLRALLRLALSGTPAGRTLQTWLAAPPQARAPARLRDLIARLAPHPTDPRPTTADAAEGDA